MTHFLSLRRENECTSDMSIINIFIFLFIFSLILYWPLSLSSSKKAFGKIQVGRIVAGRRVNQIFFFFFIFSGSFQT